MSLKRPVTAPDDLRHADPTGPRTRTAQWVVGDTVQTGSSRWIIRVITGDDVELEASSTDPGIWWRTTLANLPEKAAA